MATLLQDIRYGLRLLGKSPSFTVVIVLTLAFGVGANTALFSVVDAVLLRPLPFPEPEQLVAVKADVPGQNLHDIGMSQPELADLQKNTDIFAAFSAEWPVSSNITGREKPIRVESNAVSPNFFDLLGAKPQMGRTFNGSDWREGFTESAVISDSLWRRMYGGDPNVLGKTFRLDGDLYNVVGVMPPDFRHPGRTLTQDVEVWIAAGFAADPFPKPPVRTQRFIPGAIARLKPGLTIAQAQQKLNAFTANLQRQFPNDYPANAQWKIRLEPLQTSIIGDTSLMLFLLLAAVGAVLLIACVNIASLLLARSATRYREIAVRQALGASSWRLIRQTLTESVVLSLCGGALAIPIAFGLKSLLLTLIPTNLPRASEIALNGRALGFALGISIFTGLLFGIVPSLQMANPRVMGKLNQGSRGVGVGDAQNRFLSALVVSEFALSLVLLVGAGLLLRSFWNVLQVHPGFNTEHLVIAQMWLPVPNDPKMNPFPTQEKRNVFLTEVLRKLSAVPGVSEAAIGGPNTPFTRVPNQIPLEIQGRVATPGEGPTAEIGVTSPTVFHTLGMSLVRGRLFTESDDPKGEQVVVIDETAAAQFWPNEDPVGKQIRLPRLGPKQPWRRVIGVVGRSRSSGLDVPYAPHLYFSTFQVPLNALTVYVRTSSSADALAEPIRLAIQSVDPDLPVFGVRSLNSILSDSLAARRFAMQVLAFFALTALFLSAIGIYGVMAYFVSQRVREIGVRMALGAQRGDVLKLIVRQGMVLALAGVLIGLVAALALARLITRLLFGIGANDPITLAALMLLLASVALLANYIPARRASRVDPMTALRYE